jgi:protein SCO1/2
VKRLAFIFICAAFVTAATASTAGPMVGDGSSSPTAGAPRQSIINDIGIDQKLGAQVPTDLRFTDENGKTVQLSDYLGKRPVILSLVYYQCPMLCTMSLNDLTRAMGAMPLNPGEDFEIVTVSFDPREGPDLALAKKRRYVHEYHKPKAGEAWHFLSGDEANIAKLTSSVGFRYAWDAKFNQYAHAAGFVVLTPSGKVARYFYGVDYSSKDMRLALTEASEGKISHPVEQILLYCFHYDPSTGRYSIAILRLLAVCAAITAVGLGSYMFMNFRRDLRAARALRVSAPQEALHG